jgi:Serine dehydrogenase proteinase
MSLKDDLQKCFQEISESRKADLFVFDAIIDDDNCTYLINLVNSIKSRRENCILFLKTRGGDPDQAYKLAKFLSNKKGAYKNFILFVYDMCKSAGTSIALSADEIIMTDSGELGPLDMQIRSEESVDLASTMNMLQSLELLSEQASKMFLKCLNGILSENDPRNGTNYYCPKISVKVAESVAENVTKELLQPISSQIDPQQFVSVYRQAKIAQDYAERLNRELIGTGIIEFLLKGYPSHEFIIDRDEAIFLFQNRVSKPRISSPSQIEQELASILERLMRFLNVRIMNLETLIQGLPDDSDEDRQNSKEEVDKQSNDDPGE